MKNTAVRKQVVASVIVMSAFSLCATGCSDDKGNYTTPSSLCGIHISPELLKPVLPPGESVSAIPTSTAWNKRCRLQVDTEPAFAATIEWWEAADTLESVATDAIGVDPHDKKTPDRHYIYAKMGAVGLVECPNQRDLKRKLFVSVRTTNASATETQMKKLITSYSTSVASSKECKRRWGYGSK
ncbi:hypothetical protein [Streptomyces sp. NPDC018059]|uniref:hypothetical protein n=1 Tax=Streptomyces sp. NPDC018059 TaxID=3365041 RepID=UPI0037BBAE71